jgi:hypothetical protein
LRNELNGRFQLQSEQCGVASFGRRVVATESLSNGSSHGEVFQRKVLAPPVAGANEHHAAE